jgi:hypothetical protein
MTRRTLVLPIGAIDLRRDFPNGFRPLTFRSKPEHEIGLTKLAPRPCDADRLDLIARLVAQTRSIDEQEWHAANGDRPRQYVACGSRYGCRNGRIALN